MTFEEERSAQRASKIDSPPEIIDRFIESLKQDLSLDLQTVDAIEALVHADKLTHTNLIKRLEEIRGKATV